MSKEDDSLIDEEGIVHERGMGGQYHPKPGVFGPQRDTDWRGQPNVERDLLGRPQEERDWLGRPAQSTGGTTLYRRSDRGSSDRGSSSSGGEAIIYVILAVAVLAIGLISLAIVITPIIAPILLATTESARRRGDSIEVKKWQFWAVAASLMGAMVVFGIAGLLGVSVFTFVMSGLSQAIHSSILRIPIFIFTTEVSFIVFMLSLITGMAPTAVVFLRYKELQLRDLGKAVEATTIRRLNWILGIAVVGTVSMVVGGGILRILIGIIINMFSK